MWAPIFALETMVLTEEFTCPAYQCAETANVYFNSTTCVYCNETDYYTAACTDHYSTFCPPIHWYEANSTNSTCQLPPKQGIVLSWPGESCVNDTYCASGPCIKGICYAGTLGDDCQGDEGCSPGMFCEDSFCQLLIAPGESGCSNDTDCQNDSGCRDGVCVPYFSLPPGSPLDFCDSNINYLCQSMSCYSSEEGANCTGPLTSAKPSSDTSPTECHPFNSSYCLSVVDPTFHLAIAGDCLCSYSPAGKGYCSAFPGDPVGLDFFSYLRQWVNSSAIHQCHTQRRFSTSCMSTHWDQQLYYNFSYTALKFQYYPSMLGMDNCTKKIYLQEYFQAYQNAVGGKSSGAGIMAIGATIGLFVISA